MNDHLTKLTALILVPIFLLAAIAVVGLAEYRHSVTADAHALAVQWTGRAGRMYDDLVKQTDMTRDTILYEALPTEGAAADSSAFRELQRTADAKDEEGLRSLLESKENTPSGLPIRVLAAWRLVGLTGDEDTVMGHGEWDTNINSPLSFATCKHWTDIVIHESPSAISVPIIEAISTHSKYGGQARFEWEHTQRSRSILERHPGAQGFVMEPEGPALIIGKKVLQPEEVRSYLAGRLRTAKYPAWMKIDYEALNKSLVSPISQPFAAGGYPLKMVIGIGRPELLYARYWNVVWWVAAVIFCALITAIAGIWLVRRAVERERRLNALKSQFVASVSHELRTPVASMRLMADALNAGKVDGDTAKEFHRLMSQESARLTSLIENVLDFARIEEGRKHYEFAEADLEALVRDTVLLMEPVAKDRSVTIECDIEDVSQPPVIDSGAIQQALINLLDNAVKFSPIGGIVRVNLSLIGNRWQLSISDLGLGIPPSERQRIFERFHRLGNELRREIKGTGIGLSIVKHIVDGHNATIAVTNNSPTGAKFVILSGTEPSARKP